MSTVSTIIIIIAICIAGAWFGLWLLLRRFYRRASREMAFVRTGFGGQKVVMNAGALVIPVLHEVIPVNMNTLRLEVIRANNQALITRDRMRVDIHAEFYVRVKSTPEAVADAAQTLGRRTMDAKALQELVEGRFVDALRAVSAEMEMDELHENRGIFVQKVGVAVSDVLLKNGLELESVSLNALDQTDQSYFNPQNAFDAQGLTALTEVIQARMRRRNEVERDTEVAIRRKDLEAERHKLGLAKEEEFARLEQQREIQVRRAEQQASITAEQVEKEREAKEAEIAAKQKVDQAQMVAERQVEEERIARDLYLREKEIVRERATQIAEAEKEREAKEAEIAAKQKVDQAQIVAERQVEEERIARDLYLREKEIARERATQIAEAEKEREAKEAEIAAKQKVDQAQIVAERQIEEERIARDLYLREKEIARESAVETAEVERQRTVNLAEQDRAIVIAAKSREQIAAEAEANKVRLSAIRLEEQLATARQLEIAERQKAIDLIEARRKAEREAIGITTQAEARKKAAVEQAETVRIISKGEADKVKTTSEAEARAEITRTEAAEKRYTIEAAGKRALHEAENILDPNMIAMRVKMAIIEHLPEIIRESVKPMEAIEGIKILQVEGLNPGRAEGIATPGGTDSPARGDANLAEQVVNAALRYRGQAPLVDAILKEIGITGGDIKGFTGPVRAEADKKDKTPETE